MKFKVPESFHSTPPGEPPPCEGKQSGTVETGLTGKIQGGQWESRTGRGVGVGKGTLARTLVWRQRFALRSSWSPRATEPGWGGCALPCVYRGVQQRRVWGGVGRGGGRRAGGDTEMALNNTKSPSKKVPLPLSCAPVDYSRRKSLFPANMSLTPL